MPNGESMARPGTLANIDKDELIEDIANGAIPAYIARQLGVSKSSIHYQPYFHSNNAGFLVERMI